MVKKILLLILGWLLAWSASGQVTDSTRRQIDRQSVQDSATYARIKRNMSGGIKGSIWGILFKDIGMDTIRNMVEVNPYLEHQGKVIRKIFIKRLNVFGGSVTDTSVNEELGFFEKLGNRLHKETREQTIREQFLLFSEGDVLQAEVFWNNERLLRRTQIFTDARFIILGEGNLVDILVITQDVWSLVPEFDFSGFDRYSVAFLQRNFRGLGHTFRNTFYYDQRYRPGGAFSSTYLIPSIWKKSYVSGELSLYLQQFYKNIGIRVFKPFLTPTTKYAGAAELSYNWFKFENALTNTFDSDEQLQVKVAPAEIPRGYLLADAWLGRAFRVGIGSKDFQKNSRLVVAARSSSFRFLTRPEVTVDTNQAYQNRHELLFSVGFTNRSYKKDALIYGFGRTEDVPVGYSAAITYGWRRGEISQSNYLGLRLSAGDYFRQSGYLFGVVSLGGFYNQNEVIEQGVFSIEGNYFSPLRRWGRRFVRHFANIQFGTGINRFSNDFLNMNRENGFPDIRSEYLWGTKKLVLYAESVVFTRLRFAGFRVATFGFGQIGFISLKNQSLFQNTYTGLGLGLRLRNDNLTFDTFQIRLGFYPNIPDIGFFTPSFGSTPNLQLRDFNIDAPSILPYR
jgi:hypothetical protein